VRGRRPPRESRVATFFLLLGCFTVLAGAFTVGLFSGRRWPGLWPSIGVVREAAKSAPGGRSILAGSTAPGTRAAEPPPVLTFYHELTAPLTAPPPAAKPKTAERSRRPDGSRVERPGPPDDSDKAEIAKSDGASAERRFTVQAGAFRTREQAEAIRSKLAAAGHDAYIAEAEGSAGARYRVRAGAFGSRDEARRAAERVGAVLRLPTYVTIR
jgi:cell division septation protein DedD